MGDKLKQNRLRRNEENERNFCSSSNEDAEEVEVQDLMKRQHKKRKLGKGMSQVSSGSAKRESTFSCKLNNAQVLEATLRGIFNKSKDQHATCEIHGGSIRFVATDKSLSAQGIAMLPENNFEMYEFKDEPVELSFRINLSVLMQCLGTLGKDLQETTLKMAYDEVGEVFKLTLVEGHMITDCRIKTLFDGEKSDETDGNDEEDANFKTNFEKSFASSTIVNKVLVESSQLRDAFVELSDLPAAATVSILMSPEKPYLRLTAHGQMASCVVDFPHGSESLLNMRNTKKMEHTYRVSLIQNAGRALGVATKTFLRMNGSGTLAIQHIIKQSDGLQSRVEHFILADSDDGEDEEGDDEAEISEESKAN